MRAPVDNVLRSISRVVSHPRDAELVDSVAGHAVGKHKGLDVLGPGRFQQIRGRDGHVVHHRPLVLAPGHVDVKNRNTMNVDGYRGTSAAVGDKTVGVLACFLRSEPDEGTLDWLRLFAPGSDFLYVREVIRPATFSAWGYNQEYMASGKSLGTDERTQWLQQWKNATPALEEQRAEELRGMTPADAWDAIEAVLTFPLSTPLPEARREHSGFVEMHRFLQTLRSK